MRKAYNNDMEGFRQAQQLKHTRREWDLNRPDHKQIDLPARVGDGDARLGPASLQKFDGEDLSVSSCGARTELAGIREACTHACVAPVVALAHGAMCWHVLAFSPS